MPVIINEFEIVTAPPSAPAGPEQPPTPQASKPTPQLRPEDIERIQQRQRLRLARVWAD